MDRPRTIADLETALHCHAIAEPAQAALAAEYLAFLGLDAPVFERRHLAGHFTASAFVVSADGERALLLHHAKLQRWHWDVRYVVRCTGDESPKINSESCAFAWLRIDELATDESIDPSIRRMCERWMRLSGK